MIKLEEAKNNSMSDKNFVAALAEVLRYFRDNGELKAAYELRQEAFEKIKSSAWFATLESCLATPGKDETQFPPIDMKELEAKLMSDEYVDNKIKEVLGE